MPCCSSVATRERLEELLTPRLPQACAPRLWEQAWGRAGLTPDTLVLWCEQYGADAAALAVAAGLPESHLRRHLDDERRPDHGVLQMLAELNCYPDSLVVPAPDAG